MGSYLQEAIELYSRKYSKKVEFDVNGWRFLCKGFLDYIDNLEFTYNKSDSDHNAIESFDQIESYCTDIINVVKFLRDCRPPDEYLYARVEDEDFCEEMLDALEGDKIKYGMIREMDPCDCGCKLNVVNIEEPPSYGTIKIPKTVEVGDTLVSTEPIKVKE